MPTPPPPFGNSYAYEWVWRPGALPRLSLVPPGAARHKLPQHGGARRAYDRVETQPALHTFEGDPQGEHLRISAQNNGYGWNGYEFTWSKVER